VRDWRTGLGDQPACDEEQRGPSWIGGSGDEDVPRLDVKFVRVLVWRVELLVPGVCSARIVHDPATAALTGYVIAILTGLALPLLAVAIYFGLAIYLIVPFRETARVVARRHNSPQ
jgi:hypothetical protein